MFNSGSITDRCLFFPFSFMRARLKTSWQNENTERYVRGFNLCYRHTHTHALSSTTTGMKKTALVNIHFFGKDKSIIYRKWSGCHGTYKYMSRNTHCQVIAPSPVVLILCLGCRRERDMVNWTMSTICWCCYHDTKNREREREIAIVWESGDLFFFCAQLAVWPRNK